MSFYLFNQDLAGATVRTMSLLSWKRWCDEAIQRMTYETPGGSVRGMVASPDQRGRLLACALSRSKLRVRALENSS